MLSLNAFDTRSVSVTNAGLMQITLQNAFGISV